MTNANANVGVKPKQIPMSNKRFEQVFHQDFKHCACEMPYVSKKWNDALGTFTAIRLCCMAKAVERLTGERLYEVFEFEPRWTWDCTEKHQSEGQDGTVVMVERGPPPKWLRERFAKKGVEVRNLPKSGSA